MLNIEGDPRFDTTLTEKGQQQAVAAAAKVDRMTYLPQLIVSSPLTRALHTADLAFDAVPCLRMAHPLATERLEHSSDVSLRASVPLSTRV